MNAPTSVISAAVVGGDLILGLSDGAIINAGRVQGPKGLTGEQGPMGATGLRGTDGNTILTFEGAPQPFAGKDGDFAINVVAWEIYGPKAGGQWGTGTPLRGDTRRGRGNGERAAFDSPGAGGNGQGGGTFYNTANLSLAGTGRDGIPETRAGRITAPEGNIIPEGKDLTYQSNLNAWVYNSLSALDEALPVGKVDTLPDKGNYEGDMVLFEGALWIWSGNDWIEVGGAVDVSDFATKEYVNKTAFATTSVATTQVDWLNQTYSAGTWVLQTGGAAAPNLQRFILTGEDFADTAELGKAKYVSVHALGGGDFIHYQHEKPGDTIQIYGSPLTGDEIASFGIYEIEEITEHNLPDNPDEDGADLSDAFFTYTVKPLAFYGTVEEDEMCQIKTMPPVGAVGDGGAYVNKKGDTMTGPLVMDKADIELDNSNLEFEAKGDIDYIQNANNRFAKIVSRAPKDTVNGTTDYTSNFGIKVDLSEGNSYRNRFIVGNQHGDIVKVTSGNGAQIEFATSGFKPNLENTGLTSGIAIRHIPTPDFELSPGDIAVNKQYVDDRDETLRQQVIEIEEELEGLASALPKQQAPTPAPIGDQVLKVTGSRPTGSGGEAGKMLCWKAEAGGPGTPWNEIKFIVPDPNLFDLTNSELWLVQGDIVQHWSTAGGGWFTNGNVLHISGNLTEGDDLVDGQPVELYYSDPNPGFLDAISREESKADDTAINEALAAEIATREAEDQALQGQIDRNREESQADDRALQAEISQLALGLETLLTQRTHGQWKYIGFTGDNVPRNEGEFALASDDLSAQQNIITINLTDLNGMTIGLADVEVGDYIEIVSVDVPANYALFTCTKVPEGQGISSIEVALKDKGNNFLVGDTCEIRFFSINQENIDLAELDDRYLKLTGGQLTGQLSVDNGDQVALTIKTGNADRIKFWGSGAVALVSGYTDFKDNELVTKAYVDSKVVTPAVGRRFKYQLASSPSDGCFLFNGSDVVFSFVDLNGVIRKMTTGPDFGWTHPMRMTVWNTSGELWYAAELSAGSNWSSTAFKLYRGNVKLDRELVEGQEYDITIEGYW